MISSAEFFEHSAAILALVIEATGCAFALLLFSIIWLAGKLSNLVQVKHNADEMCASSAAEWERLAEERSVALRQVETLSARREAEWEIKRQVFEENAAAARENTRVLQIELVGKDRVIVDCDAALKKLELSRIDMMRQIEHLKLDKSSLARRNTLQAHDIDRLEHKLALKVKADMASTLPTPPLSPIEPVSAGMTPSSSSDGSSMRSDHFSAAGSKRSWFRVAPGA